LWFGVSSASKEHPMATNSESDQANAEEGADPAKDIKQQNPGETTTADLTENGADPEAADPSSAER
jgi:hypothetical protein